MSFQTATFTDVRILGRVESASPSFPGDPAEYRVSAEARVGGTVTHVVRVMGALDGAAVSAKEGDLIRVMGELGEGGAVIVSPGFGEFAVVGAAPAARVEKTATAPARSAQPPARPVASPAARPTNPTSASAPAAQARPVRPAVGGFARPGAARVSAAPAGLVAANQSRPASTAASPASQPRQPASPAGVRPGFGARGSMMAPARPAVPQAAPPKNQAAAAPARPAPSRGRGSMMGSPATVDDEPPLPGQEPGAAAATPAREASAGGADEATGRTPPARPDEKDLQIPW